jgi:hypothetical protein
VLVEKGIKNFSNFFIFVSNYHRFWLKIKPIFRGIFINGTFQSKPAKMKKPVRVDIKRAKPKGIADWKTGETIIPGRQDRGIN